MLPSGKLFILKVLRLKCEHCNHTHALLPLEVIPYRKITTQSVIDILALEITPTDRCSIKRLEEKKKEIENYLIEHECLDELYLYRIQKIFHKHWENRIKPEIISSLNLESFKMIVQRFELVFMQTKFTRCFLNAYFP